MNMPAEDIPKLKIGQKVLLVWGGRGWVAEVEEVDLPSRQPRFAHFRWKDTWGQTGETWEMNWRLSAGGHVIPLEGTPTTEQIDALVHILT